ncbi:Hypothetical protein R9X50_00156200 [Acrodontium crateriforme]|uniref:Altered inheritance of mitochondria protein 9, mitochondrial n=1 Tax=Acrodontium crateriforme TaxID=150365 RepID=A0AAQ3LZ85_9PEZI|nr:Hypothetical protein R9X50_00156200 [Acrodontium crateriforme]
MFQVVKTTIVKHLRHNCAMSTVPRFYPSFDPYTYSQGRWFDRNHEQQEARRWRFDFASLLDLAVDCSPGARRVLGCEKKEGGFNRVFMIRLDNGKTVVARLPNRIAGPPGLTVASEVATLRFVQERTKVPVPRVLAWSSTIDNVVGAEYMIMDAMPGVLLKDVWNTMTASQHIRCIQSLGYLTKELCSLDFPHYGSLYLNADRPKGAIILNDTYCIGPLCARQHWGYGIPKPSNVETPVRDRGPWKDVDAYLMGFIAQADTSMSCETKVASKCVPRSAESDHQLLNVIRQTLALLFESQVVKDAASPTLFHPDFHTRNILVDPEDPTMITGILDWQSAAIEPAFVFAAETPDFAEELPQDECLNNNRATVKDGQSGEARLQADVQFCVSTWAVILQICPKFRDASALDPSILNFLAAGSAGWVQNTFYMRSILAELGRKWEELGLPDKSVYQPGGNELEQLRHLTDEMQSTRRLREHLSRLLGCDTDGWVPMDRWDQTLARYLEEYNRFIASCVEDRFEAEDKATAIAKANKLWPFDQR